MYSLASIQTHVYEPLMFDGRSRAEFRLPAGKVFVSSLQLTRIGCTGADQPTNTFAGQLACVSRISITDEQGRTIDDVREFNRYVAFKAINSSNEMAANVTRAKYLNNWGFDNRSATAPSADPNTNQIAFLDVSSRTYVAPDGNRIPANTDDPADAAYIMLKDCMPFLAATKTLPTAQMGALTIVVEYTLLGRQAVPAAVNATGLFRPLLIADEVVSPPPAALSLSPFKFRRIVVDRTSVPAVADAVTQSITFNPRSVDGMLVRRILLVPSPTAGDNFMGELGAVPLRNISVRCAVNGQDVLAGSGLRGGNMVLGALTDAYGTCCIPAGLAFYVIPDADRFTVAGYGAGAAGSQLQTGYIGFMVNRRVRSGGLQIVFSRLGDGAVASSLQALNLFMFAEVEMSFEDDKNGGYMLTM